MIRLNDGFVPTQQAIAAATRDCLRALERMSRLCRCCGTRVHPNETIYVVGDLDSPNSPRDEWRMCGSCWRAGYAVGETVDKP